MPRTSTGKTSTPTWRTPIKELQQTASNPMTPTPVKPAVASAQHFQPVNASKHTPLDLSSLPKSALRLRSETPHHSHDQYQPSPPTDPKTPTQHPASRLSPPSPKRHKVVHTASTPNEELVFSTVTHWLESQWVSRAALLRVVESYGKEFEDEVEENVEGTSQAGGPEDNFGVTAPSPRKDEPVQGMSHYA
jgi:hypothetical protein